MADFFWPADIAPYRCLFYPQPYTGGTESPLTRTRKVYGLGATRWVARLSLRGGYDGDPGDGPAGWGPTIDALLAQLRGGQNRIQVWDFRRPRPIRPQIVAAPGGLTNAGAAAGATAMQIAGFAPFASAFCRGDYVGGDQRAHLVTAPCIADAAGVATVTFEPPLSAAIAAGSPAVVREVACWFRLTSDDAAAAETEVGGLSEYVLDLFEDLP